MAYESEDLMGEKPTLDKAYAALVERARKQRVEIEDLERINASLYSRLSYAKERVKSLEGPSHTPEEWARRIEAAEGTVEFVPATPSAASPRYWEDARLLVSALIRLHGGMVCLPQTFLEEAGYGDTIRRWYDPATDCACLALGETEGASNG